MAYELQKWKAPGCSLTLDTTKLSNREPFSREINQEFGEGGGLNASYRTAEALAMAANILGLKYLKYGEDFVFKTGGLDKISLDFRDAATKKTAEEALQQIMVNLLPYASFAAGLYLRPFLYICLRTDIDISITSDYYFR